jgi:hypothetical protein
VSEDGVAGGGVTVAGEKGSIEGDREDAERGQPTNDE